MDRDQQRQNKRNTVSGFSCTAGAELTPLKSPTGRPGADCDPTPAAPVPFAAVTPLPCPPPLPVPLNLPPGLTVSNDPATAYCPSTGGYSVTGTTASTVSEGEQQQIVLFTALANITENQLNYLYEVVPASSTAIIAAALSGATSSVIDLTHLNYDQSEELIITIQDAKFTVNTLAVEQARNLLVCQVENNLQVAQCPSGAYFGPTAAVPPSLPYVPTATASTGTVLVTFALLPSTGGQTAFAALNIPSLTAAAAQANSIALAQVESALRCVYGNAATAAACCTSEAPDNNLGFTNCVPATGPSIPGSATAVGYFSVDANTIFSTVSLTAANSVARELSRSSLNCYFPSVGVTATCAGTGSTSLGLTGLGLLSPFAPDSTTSVYLEPGAIILYDLDASVTAASEQAATLALASLNCFWSNVEQTAYCPESGAFTAINNQVYNLDASPTASIQYSSVIPANVIISYTSQVDANTQALQLAASNVSCVYCNDVVPPTCSGGVNATVGAETDLVCNASAEVAQNTAISLANILVSTSDGGIDCCYGSDAVTNTILCGTGAYYSGNTADNFTSADNFFLPANLITVCQSTTAPEPPPLLFPYSSLFATDVAQVGCCSDIQLCGGLTGSVTALPTIWSYTSNLFDVISAGATFYTSSAGDTVYEFPPGYSFVVSRGVTPRSYRSITGGTGYTQGLNYCASCGTLTSYNVRGNTAVNYGSDALAMQDMFCNGPTSQARTLYTSTANPLEATSYWYTDICGLSAFNPATGTSSTGNYLMGYSVGSTGYLLRFASTGSNAATFAVSYNISSCPLSRYAYSVYASTGACNTGAGATTLYGHLPAPELFTSYTGSVNFYTSQFNDASVYVFPDFVSGTGYINYIAPDTAVYARPIPYNLAGTPFSCAWRYRVTVQWSNVNSDEVCNYPNFYSPYGDGNFNNNIRTVWCDVENPFTDGATAIFYTGPQRIPLTEFKPGSSGTVYLSQFTPGDKFRTAYRQYSWSNTNSTLKSYTGTFKESPFLQGTTGTAGTLPGGTGVWLHSATAFYMSTSQVGSLERTKEFLSMPASSTSCDLQPVYSDVKFALTTTTALASTYKRLPVSPGIFNDLYSQYLLFDGVGYLLSSTASGTAGSNIVTLQDLSRVGAGFTGAIIRSDNYLGIGTYPYPSYISSIDYSSGVITLGGAYTNNANFFDYPVYVTGFKIEAAGYSSTGGAHFTCYGPNCDKLEVGHSLFSYKLAAPSAIGFVTKIDGSTVYYTAASGFDYFASNFTGTGSSDGSGHLYIEGRQFARFWSDDNKQQPIFSDLYSNDYNYIWKQHSSYNYPTQYTTAKNLVLGNTAGSTASFVVAGVSYNNVSGYVARPYSYDTPIAWNESLNSYVKNSFYYSCTGHVSEGLSIYSHEPAGFINTCCDLLVPDNPYFGTTAVPACSYYEIYNVPVAGTGSSNGYIGTFDRVTPDGGTSIYFDSASHERAGTGEVGSNYVLDLSPYGNGTFANTYLENGYISLAYPCGNTGGIWYETGDGFAWTRKYMGYFNADPLYSSYPVDYTYPGDFLLDSAAYWSGTGKSNTAEDALDGHVFKDYVPDLSSVTGGNCGNFLPINYSPTSGYRYSIWSSTTAGWSNSYAGMAYLSSMFGEPNTPLLDVNECTTACSDAYTCALVSDCDEGAPGAIFAASSPASQVINFSPSQYDVPTLFNFGAMPSVGGAAEDLKAEATAIAQNIVNTFVRCYYFNEFQLGKECANPSDILVNLGTVQAGEVISSISFEDANIRAKQLADSRTVCISPDVFSAVGCDGTVINPGSATAGSEQDAIAAINLSYNKTGCTFTPNISLTTKLSVVDIEVFKMKVCSAEGVSEDKYILAFDTDRTNEQIKLPIRIVGSPP